MPIYLNAALMLTATVGAILLLSKLLQRLRGGAAWRGKLPSQALLAVEEACLVDAKRRLVLVRCGEQRVVLLTGGGTDLVVCTMLRTGVAA